MLRARTRASEATVPNAKQRYYRAYQIYVELQSDLRKGIHRASRVFPINTLAKETREQWARASVSSD